tara:strand:- start:99 stop:1805 length:1707 start_codon:yes stop_codon:yes gene_type:complete
MAKLGGSATSTMNTFDGESTVKRQTPLVSSAANKIVSTRATRKSLTGIKGGDGLKSVLPKIKPIREDLKDGGIRKINKLVESRVQNLVPKLANQVEERVESFDPNKFLGKIFDGGLSSLQGFASGLDGVKGSMEESLEFLQKAQEIATEFIEKLSKAKPKKEKGKGGLLGNIFKGLALAGMAMIAVPAIATVATAGLMANAAGSGLKRSQDIQKESKKKKLEQKQDEDKVSKTEGKTDDIFSGIISKLDGVMNFNKPKNEEVEPQDDPIPLASKGKLLAKKKKKEKPFKPRPIPKQKTYKEFIDAGGTVEDTGPGNPYGREVFMDTKPKRKGLFDSRKGFQRYNLSRMGDHPEIRFLSTLSTEQFVNYILAETREYNKNKGKPPKDEKKNVRGTGAKDREREGGNFSGDKQKNVRGEYMKGAFQIPDLNLKGLMSGLVGGISGLGSKIGGGLGSVMSGLFKRGDEEKIVESMIQSSEEPKALKSQVTKQISTPVTPPPKPVERPADMGGMGVAGAALQSGMGGKTSGVNKMDREILVPTNSVPGLIAVDTKNMHVLHSKSVFNIVDAI